MTIYKYLEKYLRGLILMSLVFSYSYSVELPNQKHLVETIKEIFDIKYSRIMPENDWKDKNLKGKVKSMTEITYKYGYSGEDNNVKKVVTKFNENGYKIEGLEYYQNKENPSSVYKYRYNKRGLLVESNEYTYSYEYDKEGNLVQIKQAKNETYEGIEKNTYNTEGKLIRVQMYSQNLYDENNYFKDKKGKLYGRLTDYSYIYDKEGRLQEIRDNIFSSGTLQYTYEKESGLYVETIEAPTQKFITYYDKDGNEVYYMWVTQPSLEYEPNIALYLVFKDRKMDKYGNMTYQVGNRVEVVDITKGLGEDMGIYEKKVIEYEYYE